MAASNAVRQIRNYLQPIPLVVGVILGFLLFAIVGVFRRPQKAKASQKSRSASEATEPAPHITHKQL